MFKRKRCLMVIGDGESRAKQCPADRGFDVRRIGEYKWEAAADPQGTWCELHADSIVAGLHGDARAKAREPKPLHPQQQRYA